MDAADLRDGSGGAIARAFVSLVVGEYGYDYPLHVDENMHWVLAGTISEGMRYQGENPYTGEPRAESFALSLRGAVHERGFHGLLAQAQLLTGGEWVSLFTILPSLWLAFTSLSLYALLRPHPAALPAAALVAIIPTTVRFLGPAFLVPIAFSLAWIPTILILARKKGAAAKILLTLLVIWSFFIHLIGGFAAAGFLLLTAMAGYQRERRAMLSILLIVLIPLLWIYNAFSADVATEAAREEVLPIDFSIFLNFGIPALVLWGVGVVVYELSAERHRRPAMTALVEGSVLILLLISASVAFELDRYATYARWHHPFFLAATVPIGFVIARAAHWVRDAVAGVGARTRGSLRASQAAGIATALVVLFIVVDPAVAEHMKEPYYHVINDADWDHYQWIEANVNDTYDVFLTHPWKAPVLTAVTGKFPHTWLNPGSPPVRGADWNQYLQGSHPSSFYIENDITLVIGPHNPDPTLFTRAYRDVWLMDHEVAAQIDEARELERGGV